MVSSLNQLFEAILPAAVGVKGLSLHAVEMKTALFDNLFLYEWVVLAHQESWSAFPREGVYFYGLDSHTK